MSGIGDLFGDPVAYIRAGEGRRTSAAHDPQDAHCRTAGCACTHDGECYRGWLDRTDHDGKEIAVPCRNCRPAQRRVIQLAPDRHEMGVRLRERAKSRQWTAGGDD